MKKIDFGTFGITKVQNVCVCASNIRGNAKMSVTDFSLFSIFCAFAVFYTD